jgi:hypothetical protein
MFEDLNVWMFECLCPSIAGLKQIHHFLKKLLDFLENFYDLFNAINTIVFNYIFSMLTK